MVKRQSARLPGSRAMARHLIGAEFCIIMAYFRDTQTNTRTHTNIYTHGLSALLYSMMGKERCCKWSECKVEIGMNKVDVKFRGMES